MRYLLQLSTSAERNNGQRIVADYLLGRGIPVGHIMAVGQVTPATLTPGAQLQVGGTVWYPAPDQ